MVAIPVFRARVAPVLDWCSKILIVPEEGPDAASSHEINATNENIFQLTRMLRDQGIKIIICGALSPEMLNYGESIGLRIIYGIAGDIEEVLKAYRKGILDQPRYWLPGCSGQRRYKGGARCTDKKDGIASCADSDGRPVPGWSTPESRPKDKAMGGPGGLCVCPECGVKVSHERGIPCSQVHCPECSAAMTREIS